MISFLVLLLSRFLLLVICRFWFPALEKRLRLENEPRHGEV